MNVLANRIPFIFPSLGKFVAAVGLLVTMVLLACGGDATNTPRPTTDATDTTIQTSEAETPAMSESIPPTVADLAGGSPAAFAAAFQKAIDGSQFRATSEFAAAAQPLAEGEKLKIGFIFVGSQRDLGYNQAAAEGADYLEKVSRTLRSSGPRIFRRRPTCRRSWSR